jgi:hypothetical protein
MLEPNQFKPNDAWIVFRLNDAPISTQEDGDFNVLCLMDAASCYILGNEFIPIQASVAPAEAVERLVATARAQAGCVPPTFFVSPELQSGEFATLSEDIGAAVVFASTTELSPFISEAKEGFLAHIGGGKMQ